MLNLRVIVAMKSSKLRFTVSCTSRAFYLSKVKGRNDWHIKFTPPAEFRSRLGQRVVRNLGTLDIAPAKIKARRIIEAAWRGDGSEELKLRAGYSSVEEILERYRPLPQLVSPDVATKNRAALRLLVKEGANVDAKVATAGVFASGDIVRNFQKGRMEAVRNEDYDVQQRTAVTINSTVRQALSVFAKEHMELYAGLSLPDLTKLRAVPAVPVDRDYSFVPFPAGVIERIEAELPNQSRNVQLACLLMLRLGMRNKEVEHAKWEWFSRWVTGAGEKVGQVSIERRPYFRVKNNSVRTIGFETELLGELEPFWGAPDEWVINAPTATDRYDVTHYGINEWLRPMMPDRTKCAYELRKHAGSVILTRPESEGGGLAAAARFLGDTIQTTEKHYARFLKRVHAVRAAEVRGQLHVLPAPAQRLTA